LYNQKKYTEAVKAYSMCEQYCMRVLDYGYTPDTTQEKEVQLHLCQSKLNSSLCLQRLNRFEEAYECCNQVLKDRVSSKFPIVQCKAAIRAGQCLDNIAIAKGREDMKQVLLAEALKNANHAEQLCGDDKGLMDAIKVLRKSVRDKQSLQVDYSKGLRTLPDVPVPDQKRRPASNTDSSGNSSDSDTPYQSTRAAAAKRRGAVSTYPSTISNAHDVYGKSPYGYSRQRLARFPGIRNEGATCWGNCILQVIYHLRSFRLRLGQVATQILQLPGDRAADQSAVAISLLQVFDHMDRQTAEPGQEAFDSVSAMQLWRACAMNVSSFLCVIHCLLVFMMPCAGVEAERHSRIFRCIDRVF